VDVEASFPADGEAPELVEQGEGLFDDVPHLADAFDSLRSASGDDRFGLAFAALGPERGAVIPLVGQHHAEAAAGPARNARDRWDTVQQCDALGDVRDVPAGSDDV